jgi:hypothetical protein
MAGVTGPAELSDLAIALWLGPSDPLGYRLSSRVFGERSDGPKTPAPIVSWDLNCFPPI